MPKWYDMFVEKKNGKNIGVIKIYDEIGGWGITSAMFDRELEYLGAIDELKVYINSPGGDIAEGLTIYNIIKRQPVNKTTIVDGVASSMASVVFMAGDARLMADGTFLMIHNPAIAGFYADAERLRKYAVVLDMMKQSIIGAYLQNVKIKKEDVDKLMDFETWINSERAVLEGWATGVEGTFQNKIQFKPLNFCNIPDSAKKFFSYNKSPDSVPGTNNSNRKEIHMDLEQLKKEHPDLYNQVFNLGRAAGVSSERARLQGIESLDSLGHTNIVAENKFKDDMTAEKLAVIINAAESQSRAAAASAHQAAGQNLAAAAGQIQAPGVTLDSAEQVEKERKEYSKLLHDKIAKK